MSFVRLAWPFVLCAALAGCRGPTTKQIVDPPPPPPPQCNDGKVDPGEDCDGSDFADATCTSLGFDLGTLACDSNCHFVLSLCVKRCGNGVLDTGETCDGALGLQACTTFGYQACSDQCAVDLSHCLTPPFQGGPGLDLTKGGPTALGDLTPKGAGDLLMAVPSFSRVETFPWNVQLGFDVTQGRKLSFQRTPAQVAAADVDGDGHQDVCALNDDGAVDVFRYNGTGFTPATVPDAGCLGGSFAGTGRFAPDAGTGFLLAGCPAGGALVMSGATSSQAIGPLGAAVALADLDGDGATDVLAVDGTRTLTVLPAPGFVADGGLTLTVDAQSLAAGDLDGDGDVELLALDGTDAFVLENTGAGFGLKQTIPAPGATDPRVLDLDLDGQADLFWAEPDAFVVRRNRGQYLFSEWRTALPTPGPRLSVSVGDVDGDGDPDVAVTWSLGGDATRTLPYLNRVR